MLEPRVDPTLAHPFIGWAVDVLEQQEPDDKARPDHSGAISPSIQSQSVLPASCAKRMLQIGDLIKPCPEQIAFAPSSPAVSVPSLSSAQCDHGI